MATFPISLSAFVRACLNGEQSGRSRGPRVSAFGSLAALTFAGAAGLVGALASTPAHADDFASAISRMQSRDSSVARRIARPSGPSRPSVRQARGAASGRLAVALPALDAPMPEGPLVLVVSLAQQRMSVYSAGRHVETTSVSTGKSSDPTPSGVFAVIEKNERHFSNLYNGAPMPFMQRLTMSGVALHSGHVTGRVESHGCVRLPHEYARRLFKMTRLGARVIISDDAPMPVDFLNMPLLTPERIAGATQIAAVQVQGGGSDTMSDGGASPPAPAARDRSIDLRTGRPKGPLSLQRDEVLRAAPVSILVSRADAIVYVRHMFEPLIEMPITIAEPRRPLGTHVFTLAETQADGRAQRWSAITVKLVPRRLAAVRVLAGRGSRTVRHADAARSSLADDGAASTAAEAVERFSLPNEVIAQIAPLLRPGASLIVTDLPQSRRTQTGWTDVIVTPSP